MAFLPYITTEDSFTGGSMRYRTFNYLLLITGMAMTSSATLAADAPAPVLLSGASGPMMAQHCDACHGPNGISSGPAIPSIAGISPEYFVELMQKFASGESYSTVMDRMAKAYTEDELKLLAKYYSTKPFVKAKQNFDSAKVKDGAKLHEKYCEKCHAKGGTSAEDDAGILAGQWTPYLQWTLDDYRAGKREPTKKMKKKLEQLIANEGDAGIEALLSYYASQQ
jgi:sulfide dehydrogenase cytochrome subunit